MSKTLVIVESPAKAKTINKYLGPNYIVKASFGHVRDLPEKEMGVNLDNDFEPTYEVTSDKVKVVKELVALAKECDAVLLAGDPDREGEAISWHLEQLLKKHCSDIKRVTFNEITQGAIIKAVENPRQVDTEMVDSQQARRILDRIVGYQLSPWLGGVLRSKLSAGRVQSIALRVIVDREREIENFKPEEYWKIYAQLTPQTEKFPFSTELMKKGSEALKLTNKAEVDAIVQDLDGATFNVDSVEKKEKAKKPAAPFTTSTLQQEAIRKLKWDSSKAMKVAQNLYEGVDVGDGSVGLITYMRTDSTRISEDFQATTSTFIKSRWGDKYAPPKFNSYKTKGDAQDAHEAVRPTKVEYDPEAIKDRLTADQYSLYKLIWDRYVASQMTPAMYDTVTVNVLAKDYAFKATGSSLKFDGFMTLYLEDKDVEENGDTEQDDSEIMLPQLDKGQELDLLKMDSKQKFTSPPSRYTEATLIKELEAKGVGRPSTYASIISTIIRREYVTVTKTRFNSSELGRKVIDLLVDSFPDVMEIEFTARMEDNLDLVAEGKTNWVEVLYDFYTPFSKALSEANANVKPMVREDEMAGKDCPKCGKPLVIRKGKTGKFISCSGYPDCNHMENFVEAKDKTGVTCDKCGKGEMIIKSKKVGRKTEKWAACDNYPECKNNKTLDAKGKIVEKAKAEVSEKECPKCSNPLLIRESKTGKFYACSGYPTCTHTEPFIDDTVKTIDCDKCGKKMIHRKGQYGWYYGCSGYPTCNNIVKADEKGGMVEKPKAETSDKKCGKCSSPMVLRSGANGKFYACSGYPKCKNTEPYFAPGEEIKKCPKCDKPLIKRKGAKGEFYGCSGYPTCNHIENA